MLIGAVTARVFTTLLDQWAWIGVFPVYWTLLLFIVIFFGRRGQFGNWFGRSRGSR